MYKIITLLCLTFCAQQLFSESTVWWEAEDYDNTDFPESSRFSPTNERERDLLSGRDWVSIANYESNNFLEYTITVPETAEYYFYSRRFFSHGPFRYRFDDGEWMESGKLRLMEGLNLRLFLSVNWVKLQSVTLEKGQHTFRIEQMPVTKGNSAAYDCFLLTEKPFIPRGKFKPGEQSDRASVGKFAFNPVADPLTDDAELNLRYLNEKRAGQSGFITRKDDKFYRGDGEEIRFWTMTLHSDHWDHETLSYMVKRLAKQGFNMLRVYIPVFDQDADTLDVLNEYNIDTYHFLAHCCSEEGMYLSINTFFAPMCRMKESYGFEGYEPKEQPHNLPYVSPRFQSYYRYWMRELLTRTNVYTGKSLVEDPSIAMIQILSEDSLLWWLALPDEQKQHLEQAFGFWSIERYGSVKKAYQAWGGAENDKDDAKKSVLRLFPSYNMTVRGYAELDHAEQKRCSDQVTFIANFQRRFFERHVDFYRELGYKGLIAPTGFGTADPRVLEDIEHYTHLVSDMIDRHHYPLAPHVNPTRSFMATYAIHEGDMFEAMSFMKDPGATVLRYKTVAGHPAIISEFGWVNPSPYKLEGPLFTAAYASLIGLDCLQWFGGQSAIDFSHKIEKFAFRCPEVQIQNPAAALIYRRGYVQEGPQAVVDAINPETMTRPLKERIIYDLRGYDPTRKQDMMHTQNTDIGSIDPFAFFVGKVQADFSTGAEDYVHADLNTHINRDEKTVSSLTKELHIDYGKGVFTINAAKAQSLSGYSKDAGVVELNDVTIQSSNAFSAIAVVPLDDRPLSSSQRVLVQVATPGMPYGFETEPASFKKAKKTIQGKRIINTGTQPWNMEEIVGRVTFKRKPVSARILDGNGYAVDDVAQLEGNVLQLPVNRCYVIVSFK